MFLCALRLGIIANDLHFAVIAGFFTGGALAVRGGVKAARNSAIMCAVFLAVIEGVGIGFQRMMADNTKLEVRSYPTFVSDVVWPLDLQRLHLIAEAY